MGTWSKYAPILFKFSTHIEFFREVLKTEFERDSVYIVIFYVDLSGALLKFWGTLLWVPGLNMDRFRLNSVHAFVVLEKVYRLNLRRIVYNLWLLWVFK